MQTNQSFKINALAFTFAIAALALSLYASLGLWKIKGGAAASGNVNDADFNARVEKSIEAYIQKNSGQPGAGSAPTAPTRVSGDFADDDAIMGQKNAPVTLIEFSDYQCPFCRKFYNETLPQIKTKYIDTGKVRLVYRDFPLGFHPFAKPAAMAAECAREQGGDAMYFKFHDRIFEEQEKRGQGTVQIDPSELKNWAKDMGLKTTAFNECVDTEKFAAEIDKDLTDGKNAGISGTPGFLLNGQLISGAQPFSVFEQAIEAELKP